MNKENNAAPGQSREAMMKRLQEINLTLVDLTQYLDTHVGDSFALKRRTEAGQEYGELLSRFEQLFGPISLSGQSSDPGTWQWALQDFPWDEGR